MPGAHVRFGAGVLKAEGIRKPRFSYEEQRYCSEWHTTALRHRLFHRGRLSDRFLREVPSNDEFDGWADL
eukprot:6855158-Pyramimonas_sp.AAC.1